MRSGQPGPLIIDFHTHIMPPEFSVERSRYRSLDATLRELFADDQGGMATGSQLVKQMDKAGIDVSVAVGYGWTDAGVARTSNDYILDAARKHPERIVPFCSVNPLWSQPAVEEVRRCVEAGARGIGELHPDTQGIISADLATLAPVLDAARELGVPTLIHASEPVGHAYQGKGTVTPEMLEVLVRAYPDNMFVFAHFGGGMPFYALMPEVAASLTNVYFDSAAFTHLYRPEVFHTAVTACGVDRILFASDYPLVSQTRALRRMRKGGLSKSDEAAVLGGNAARLLKLNRNAED